MYCLVMIHHAIVALIMPIDAGDIVLVAIAPTDEQRITLFPGGIGHVVSGERKLVCVATEPSISDFGGALVSRPRGEGEAEKETQYEQQFTLHRPMSLRVQM